ncbi:PA2169 family four-helix-bundle protein [Olivibacter ginsenosidimutans]|uniref:PA2169 family four-helix-bundle protein n=1 Tax=Olivibacter ginsenosidimutans TaxID=1176537 RepID=A0ABP9ABJ4_9SPHI
METSNVVSTLNDLIEINNDRVAGFEKAMADIKDENLDLKTLFQEFSSQSRKFSQELTSLASRYTDDVETGTSAAGNLHRAWIDIKSLFGGSDRKSILEEAERGEDAIKKAYNDALKEGTFPVEATSLITQQAAEIKRAHDKIKALRDSA